MLARLVATTLYIDVNLGDGWKSIMRKEGWVEIDGRGRNTIMISRKGYLKYRLIPAEAGIQD